MNLPGPSHFPLRVLDTPPRRPLLSAPMTRTSAAAVRFAVVIGILFHGIATAQTYTPPPVAPPPSAAAAPPPILTLFTIPENADVSLDGSTDIVGRTPLDLPPTATGNYSIVVEGAGFSRTQGVIVLPTRGQLPFVTSEPPGVSPGLLLRGFNWPGVPSITSGRVARGMTMTAVAAGTALMAVRSHFSYRQRLDEVGDFAADRARDEKRFRDAWLIYGGAVWGVSALDYWIRPRLDLSETTPTRLTLEVPKVSRVGAVWRSLLVPGAGQEFANHRTRSIVWLGAALLSGAGYVVADYRVQRDETNVKWAEIFVDSAGPSEVTIRELELERQRRDLQASEDLRRGFAIATASIYALNFIDALIMPLTLPVPTGPKVSSIRPILLPEAPGIAVSLRF